MTTSPVYLSFSRFLRLSFVCVGLLWLSACAMNPVTGRNELALMQVTPAQEVQLGMRAYPAAIQQMGGEVPDLQLQGYVQQVGKRVAIVGHRPEFEYQFRVVNQPAPNAFALPGGYIAITRGLLARLENEAQLAAVLGHEIVHVTARHAVQGLQRGALTQLAVSLLGQTTGNQQYGSLAMQAGQVGAQLLENSFSREQERESDRIGIDYMVAAGYDPRGAIGLQEVFLRMENQQQEDWLNNLFRTHPFSKERLASNRRYIETRYTGITGSSKSYLGKDAYQKAIRYVLETEPGYQLYSQALTQESSGQSNLAIQTLHEALKFAPQEALIHTAIGLAYLRQEDLLSARRYFRQAIELDSDHYQSQMGLGYVHLKRKEFPSSVRFLKRGVDLLATTQGVYLLGEAFMGTGQLQDAAESFRAVVDADRNGRLGQAAQKRLAELEMR